MNSKLREGHLRYMHPLIGSRVSREIERTRVGGLRVRRVQCVCKTRVMSAAAGMMLDKFSQSNYTAYVSERAMGRGGGIVTSKPPFWDSDALAYDPIKFWGQEEGNAA
jgi:hypothetical protein